MSGTKHGGLKAAATNRMKYGSDFYSRNGKLGGRTTTLNTRWRGFGTNRELARIVGSKGGKIGGKISRRKTNGDNKKPGLLANSLDN